MSTSFCVVHKRLLDPIKAQAYPIRMPTVSCRQCSASFYVKPNRLARGWGKYCSNDCKNAGFKTGSLLPCATCKKPTYKNKLEQTRSKSGKYFCSKSCQTVWRNSELYVGSKHTNWTNGESSYRDILRRANIPMICTKCRTRDKRILAVHHKDKNRQNNDITNLTWLCHNCHFLVHHYKSEAGGFLSV